MTTIITNAAALVPALSFSKKKSGKPVMSAAAKQTICRFVRLKATFVFIFDKSFGTGTYAIPKTSFPSKLYAVLCFIPPCVPARRFLPCEKLYPGNVAHKGNDFFPRYIRLFAVLLDGGDNELMNTRRFSLWVSPCGKQAEFRVSPRPKSQAVKPCVGFFIEFQPYKGGGLVGKAPSLDKPQGFGELWECRPQKKRAVLCRKVSHGKRAKFLYAHGRVVVFCRAGKPLLCVLPRGIGVDYAVFLFNGFLSLLSVCFLLSPIKGNQGKGQSLPFACPYSMGFSRVKVGSYFRRFALKISTLPLTRL